MSLSQNGSDGFPPFDFHHGCENQQSFLTPFTPCKKVDWVPPSRRDIGPSCGAGREEGVLSLFSFEVGRGLDYRRCRYASWRAYIVRRRISPPPRRVVEGTAKPKLTIPPRRSRRLAWKKRRVAQTSGLPQGATRGRTDGPTRPNRAVGGRRIRRSAAKRATISGISRERPSAQMLSTPATCDTRMSIPDLVTHAAMWRRT